MVFSTPPWVPQMSGDVPTTLAIGDFMLNGCSGMDLQPSGKPPFVDVSTENVYSIKTIRQRVDWVSRSLALDLGWSTNEGSPWDKVVAIHALNNMDYFLLCWAIHRLNGICMPIHSTSTVAEMAAHMATARCQTVFTCQSLKGICLEVAKELSIPVKHLYTVDAPDSNTASSDLSVDLKCLDQLVAEGSLLKQLEPLRWEEGQGKTQVAYLCATSGTSGKQKLAMITHYGLMVNVMQATAYESLARKGRSEVATGAIPFSHSYGLLLGHLAVWRRDTLVVVPRFDMQLMLSSIPKFRIERLYIVPSILAALAANDFLFDLFDLSTVRSIVTGAAALSGDLTAKLHVLQPKWQFLHAYGLTETCVLATLSSSHDIWYGSSGSLLPECQIRLVGLGGEEISQYGQLGEVLFKSPSLFVGYLGDEEATKTTLDNDGWLHTGDVGIMQVGPNGSEHLSIRDRLKDMIKVKGMQVIPADIEGLLLAHPAIMEVAVIGVPDDIAGERPQAFVVRSKSTLADLDEELLRDSINEQVEQSLHETHWLNDRVEFVAEIPKSQNGKVLKRELRVMMTLG
ncbi:hypothetical protein G7046_g407 [Stylonectria norvegica]|nr:hypothetical protein G7046_g407 [Stylonectria norvegica]